LLSHHSSHLAGTEYIVNAVVMDGVVKTTAMWQYDKRPYNGAPFVCYGKFLLAPPDQPHLPEILKYTEDVLSALNFRNGAVHVEIMYTKERGPVLVEVNCRLHGGNGAWVRPAELVLGYSQLGVMMDVYLNKGKGLFASIPPWPETFSGGCHQVKMRSRVCGTLEEIIPSQVGRILSLASYEEHVFSVRPGDRLLRTVDMPSVPGEVTLVHRDKARLEADYRELNNILHEGIFKVKVQKNPSNTLRARDTTMMDVAGRDKVLPGSATTTTDTLARLDALDALNALDMGDIKVTQHGSETTDDTNLSSLSLRR
jgi:biotin carboxylase